MLERSEGFDFCDGKISFLQNSKILKFCFNVLFIPNRKMCRLTCVSSGECTLLYLLRVVILYPLLNQGGDLEMLGLLKLHL